MLIAIAPKRQPRLNRSMPLPTVEEGENLLVISFDGSAWVKRKSGAYNARSCGNFPNGPLWQLHQNMRWIEINTPEYRGLLLGFDLLDRQTRERIIICGDFNLVIRQMRGEIDCKAPGLQLLRHKAMQRLQSWPKHESYT